MKLRHFFSFFFALLFLSAFSACDKHTEPDNGTADVKVKIAVGDLLEQEVRSVATDAEKEVKNMTVLFFDKATGNRVGFNNVVAYFFDLDNIDPNQWEGGSTASQTVILNVAPPEVVGKKAVVLMNLPANLLAKVRKGNTDADYIGTYNALNAELARTITAINEISTPLLMTGDKDVNALTDIVDNTIIVDVKRAVAKMQLHLYYQWEGLRIPSATNKAYYAYKEYEAKTFLGVSEAIDTRIDGSEQLIDHTKVEQRAEPLRPKSVFEPIYINEYNIEDLTKYPIATTPAPYILLRLPAVLGTDNPVGGIFPPPAGGENENNNVVYNFYKVVMPRRIERNFLYHVHATIVGPGSPTPDTAPILKFELSVLPWVGGVTIY